MNHTYVVLVYVLAAVLSVSYAGLVAWYRHEHDGEAFPFAVTGGSLLVIAIFALLWPWQVTLSLAGIFVIFGATQMFAWALRLWRLVRAQRGRVEFD